MTPEEETRGWEGVRERWTDDEVHRAWLAGFTDLEGLARAGRRYAEALAADPADPIAARWRAEILKRATVHGLAQLPRTAPRLGVPPWLVRTAFGVVSALFAVLLWWVVTAMRSIR